ncbi:hypothetical protein [Profundibacterium mesophilum]|uniref:Uncharacterized protein n=1 Tax=Profundibacterium mesophilum KAUST100406-0324 TaxID=1037889 RepID=A0A921NSD2_9RHOB|nr:hypothetical protein [Profundibacterium mesophilum]KAF0674463.1 hypothetical protein PMES_03225 [Profundibacterium mesophilum KAUST100406-0324]
MTVFDDEMMKALEADGEYLRQMTAIRTIVWNGGTVSERVNMTIPDDMGDRFEAWRAEQ